MRNNTAASLDTTDMDNYDNTPRRVKRDWCVRTCVCKHSVNGYDLTRLKMRRREKKLRTGWNDTSGGGGGLRRPWARAEINPVQQNMPNGDAHICVDVEGTDVSSQPKMINIQRNIDVQRANASRRQQIRRAYHNHTDAAAAVRSYFFFRSTRVQRSESLGMCKNGSLTPWHSSLYYPPTRETSAIGGKSRVCCVYTYAEKSTNHWW